MTEEVEQRAVIKSCGDMNEDMKKTIIEISLEVMSRLTSYQGIADELKDIFDRDHDPTWHCVVGRHFGSVVTHELGHYIYFYVG